MFLSLDGTFFVQLINFAIFFAILNVVFLRPVQKAIAARREYIESLTRDYDRAQAEANELRARAGQIHAEARSQADAEIAAGRAQAGNEAAKIAAEYAARAQKVVEEAQAAVAAEVDAVRPRQDALAVELARSIVGKVLPEQKTA
ncbi:MAG: ATP synthase F0 subunit B [bacterium]|nr:ATP synthase F0 subunit B [bacterium]